MDGGETRHSGGPELWLRSTWQSDRASLSVAISSMNPHCWIGALDAWSHVLGIGGETSYPLAFGRRFKLLGITEGKQYFIKPIAILNNKLNVIALGLHLLRTFSYVGTRRTSWRCQWRRCSPWIIFHYPYYLARSERPIAVTGPLPVSALDKTYFLAGLHPIYFLLADIERFLKHREDSFNR